MSSSTQAPISPYDALPKCGVCTRYNPSKKSLCAPCIQEYHSTAALWNSATTWRSLILLSRRFIRGELRFQPGYNGPLDAESAPLVTGFLHLHDLGFITYSSQPEHSETAQREGETWGMRQQRPFLHVVVPTVHAGIAMEALDVLVGGLMGDGELLVTVFSEYHTYPTDRVRQRAEGIPVPATLVERRLHAFRTTAPAAGTGDGSGGRVCVTRSRHAETRKGLVDSKVEWETEWIFPVVDTQCVQDDQGDALRMIRRGVGKYKEIVEKVRPICIHITTKQYNAGIDLQQRLRDYCAEAGMRRSFLEDGDEDDDEDEDQDENEEEDPGSAAREPGLESCGQSL